MANDQSISFKPGDFHPLDGEFSFDPSAFQPLDDKGEAPVSKPAPAQTKGLDLPDNMAIRTAQPSVWDRISNVFTSGIPSLSSRTSTNPKYGQMQILSPEESMTPAEQERHPVLTATGEVAGGLTSPGSVGLLAATGGLGQIGGAAAKILPRLISGGFAAQQIYSAAKKSPDIWNALKAGDGTR